MASLSESSLGKRLYNAQALRTQIHTKSIQDFGALKIARESRTTKYKLISQICQRYKETVRAQYRIQSVEYKLVKGLKI